MNLYIRRSPPLDPYIQQLPRAAVLLYLSDPLNEKVSQKARASTLRNRLQAHVNLGNTTVDEIQLYLEAIAFAEGISKAILGARKKRKQL